MRLASYKSMSERDDTETTEAELPATQWFDDRGECTGCGKTKDRVLVRVNKRGAPKLCEECNR